MFDPNKIKNKNLHLHIEPDPVLREKTIKVHLFDEKLQSILDDMQYICRETEGIAIAAPQVGLLKKIIVMDLGLIKSIEKDPDAEHSASKEILYIINPEIIKEDDEKVMGDEGCLSLPEVFYQVERPKSVTIKYQDEKGNVQTLSASGLLSRCIYHEIDHLNGILFIDYLSKIKKDRTLKKLAKIKKKYGIL